MYAEDISLLDWEGRQTKHIEAILLDPEYNLDYMITDITHKHTL